MVRSPHCAKSTSLLELRMHYELRKTRSLVPREACARVFSLDDRWGLVDASGALWPVEFSTSAQSDGVASGDVIRAQISFLRPGGGEASRVSKYEDTGFLCAVGRIAERVVRTTDTPWPLEGIPAPGPADVMHAVQQRNEWLARGEPDGTWYLDSGAGKRATLIRARGLALERTRAFFERRGFLSCETPSLVPSGGVETYLSAFETTYEDHRGARIPLSLPTSPEFALKKLLVEGHDRVFQLARAFRNRGELARWHEPEFIMLEWYRRGATLDDLQRDTRALVDAIATTVGSLRTLPLASEAWPTYTVEELFRARAGIELRRVQDVVAFRAAAKASTAVVSPVGENDDWDTVFHKVFLDAVEPFLGTLAACFVVNFPVQMAALAQATPDGPFALRFEAYLFGVEICNGYQELTDAQEAQRRFSAVEGLRGTGETRRDVVFEGALRFGLPPCAGNALGIDRVTALLLDIPSLSSLYCTPFLSQFPRGAVASD